MAELSVNGRRFEIELVIFDKDGTLVDFHHLWGQKTRLWVAELVRRANGGEPLRDALCRGLGYDPQTGRVADDGPVAVTSMPKLHTIAAAVLYQHGLGWHAAEQCVQASLATSIGALPTPDLIRPLGDVPKLFQQLTQAGVQIAIATSDNRAFTQATLPLLGVEEQVSIIVCGDDDIPNKPAPDAIWHIGAQLNVEPQHIMMVGDTVSDMVTGTRAGVGCRVGVLNGVGERAILAAHADVLLDSIDEILVVS